LEVYEILRAHGSLLIKSVAKVGPEMTLMCLAFNSSFKISDKNLHVLFSIPLLAIQIGVFL